MNKIACDICGELYLEPFMNKHRGSIACLKNLKKKQFMIVHNIDSIYDLQISNNTYKCPYCDETYSIKGIYSHIWRNHTDKGINFTPSKGIIPWNKGLTIDTSEMIRLTVNTVKQNFKLGLYDRSSYKTDEYRKNASERAKLRNFGGTTQSRYIIYQGKRLGSSYEVEVAKSLDENNVKWDVCTYFRYIDPFGKKRKYTPDIYLIDYDVYLDPKNDFLINYINPHHGFSDVDKIRLVQEQNNIKVIILNKYQLKWEVISRLI